MGSETTFIFPDILAQQIFMLLYASVKWAQLAAFSGSTTFIEALPLIWHVEDQAIFAGIISFYFGQRAMSKLRQGR